MRIIRYYQDEKVNLAAVTDEDKVYPLIFGNFLELVEKAKETQKSPLKLVEESIQDSLPIEKEVSQLNLLVPIEAPEVWACGVTYEKSRDARNYEATQGKLDANTFYDKVYDAVRPELFFKSTKDRTVGPNQEVCLRSDSNWQIPEPELGLVLDHSGEILGYIVGNDMSCRDIEGENPLYLPQAKMWKNSCSLGPAIRLAETVEDPYDLVINCKIYRQGAPIFDGSANTSQLKRRYDELSDYLTRDNVVFDGTVLLTGTCIVPPDDFTLQEGDQVDIQISGIGTLSNPIVATGKKHALSN